jgi:hypothetical protein
VAVLRRAAQPTHFSTLRVQLRPARSTFNKVLNFRCSAIAIQNSMTRGFAAIGEPNVAVCLLPGTEVAFEKEVKYERTFSLFSNMKLGKKVAQFRQINMGKLSLHRDALEFPDGETVLLTRLCEGQHATVLQLPASPRPVNAAERQKGDSLVR